MWESSNTYIIAFRSLLLLAQLHISHRISTCKLPVDRDYRTSAASSSKPVEIHDQLAKFLQWLVDVVDFALVRFAHTMTPHASKREQKRLTITQEMVFNLDFARYILRQDDELDSDDRRPTSRMRASVEAVNNGQGLKKGTALNGVCSNSEF